MAKRLAGVALAAVMACGWASGAEAFPIYTIEGLTANFDFGVSLSASFNRFSGSYSALYHIGDGSCDYGYSNVCYTDTTITDSRTSVNISPVLFDGAEKSRDIYLYSDNASFHQDIVYNDGSPESITSFTSPVNIHFHLEQVPGDGSGIFGYATYSFAPLGFSFGDFGYFNPTFSGNILSPVPLPSSAPMFGAALIGLAAVGYGTRRRKAA